MSKTDTTAKNSMATFFKVLRFIGKYRFLLVLSVILAAVTVILQLYVPVLFGYAIDEVVAAHEVDFTRMGFYLSRILVMIVFSGIATWIMSVINNRMTYRTVQDSVQDPSAISRSFLCPTWTDTAPVISSAVSSQIRIFFPMVCSLDLHSCFPVSSPSSEPCSSCSPKMCGSL